MAKIQEADKYHIFYLLLLYYVHFIFWRTYHRREYYGKENLFVDGASILVPNHSNALMDAMAVVCTDKRAKVYTARADIFVKPIMRKILTFFKILPINRIRDGVKNLSKNEQISELIVDVLRDRIPFCIFSEGTHRMKHSLLPLGKGVCRIALQANEALGSGKPIYIIPVGLEFGHFTRFRSSFLMQVGTPFDVTQFIEEHAHLETAELINVLRDKITLCMQETMLQIPDDENYDGILELCHLWSGFQKEKLRLKKNSLLTNFLAAKETVSDVFSYLKNQPEKATALIAAAKAFSVERHEKRIRIPSMHHKHLWTNVLLKSILLLAGLPYFIASAFISAPVTLLAEWICSKLKDSAFHNSARFLVLSFFYPLWLIALNILFFIFFPWIWALAGVIISIPTFLYVYDYLRWMRLFISDIKWLKNKELRNKFDKLSKTAKS